MKTRKTRFTAYSIIIFLSLISSSLICTFVQPMAFALLSYFIAFVGIIVTFTVFIIGLFLDRKGSLVNKNFSNKKIIKNLILLSLILITSSIIFTSISLYIEKNYVNELEKEYIGLSKKELLLKLRETKASECPVGSLGRSINVSKDLSEELVSAKFWYWDCSKRYNRKHGWRSYKFIFNNNMFVEKVIIDRIFDGM